MDLIPKTKSRFIKVKCQECNHETILFNHAKTIIECPSKDCSAIIARPSGGKALILAEIIEKLS